MLRHDLDCTPGQPAHGKIEYVPQLKATRIRESRAPALDENALNRLFVAARSMPGETSEGVKAGDFWAALLLVMLDVRLSAPAILDLSHDAFDRGASTLMIDGMAIQLRAVTSAAIRKMDVGGGRLFQWPADVAMLYYRFRELLWRAEINTRANPFARIRSTAELPDAIDRIRPDWPFIPRALANYHPRRREGADGPPRPRSEGPAAFEEDKPRNRKRRPRARETYLISHSDCSPSPTLLDVFETKYRPLKLCESPACTADSYRCALRQLNQFAACEVLCAQVSDEMVEGFSAWLSRAGYAPHTRKKKQGRNPGGFWRHGATARNTPRRSPLR